MTLNVEESPPNSSKHLDAGCLLPASPWFLLGSRVSSCDPSGGHGTSPRTSPCQSPGKRDATEAKSVSLKQSYSQIIHLVEEGVEGPGEEEAGPANGHHDPHLARAQGVRDPVDVNQLHVLLHAQLCGDAQPGIREQNKLLEHIYACKL